MKALSLTLALALSANAVIAADALDCETILASEDSDGNIAYFKRTNGRFPEKAAKLAKARDGRQFDKTLPPPRDEDQDIERTHFFKEMKKREF